MVSVGVYGSADRITDAACGASALTWAAVFCRSSDFETRTSPRSMVRWHIPVLPLYSEWQHVHAQRKLLLIDIFTRSRQLLLIDTPQLCCAGARLVHHQATLTMAGSS